MTTSRRSGDVFLIHPFDALAGSQRVAALVCEAVRALGHTCRVHLGFGTNGFVSEVPDVSRFMPVNVIPLRKLLYPLWIVALMPRLFLAVWRGEIVWANTVHAIPAVLPALWIAPDRVVVHLHEIEFPRLFLRLATWATRRGAKVLCVSEVHRERVALPACVLPNCVKTRSDAQPAEPPILLFVGAVSAVKGFPLFVKVAQRLKPAGVRTVACVPDIPATGAAFAVAAREAGIELRCGLSDPTEMFFGATLTLQCTDPALATETFSLVMVESMACGVPVATAGMAVAPEILGDAWAFDEPSRNPDRIAQQVMALLSDGPRLGALREAAIRRREHFSFEAFKARIDALLHRAMGGKI